MTTLLPSFPVLREIDAKLLRIFHRMGSIPIAAVQWSKPMKESDFVISADVLTEIHKYISDSTVLADDIAAELRTDLSIDSARYRFTRNLALYVSLSNLDSNTRFVEDYPDEAVAFEKAMASYFTQSQGSLPSRSSYPSSASIHYRSRSEMPDETTDDPAEAAPAADLVVIATPLSAYADIGRRVAPALKEGAILTDVGSVKQAVIRDLGPHVPPGVHFVPGDSVAGAEHSGPEAGFAELFAGRWCILIPLPETPAEAVTGVTRMWGATSLSTTAKRCSRSCSASTRT